MTDPLPEINRVRGGGSARIGAVVLGIALIGVVGVGIFGRQSPGPVSALAPQASAAQSSAGSGLPNASPVPAATAAPSATPAQPETYGVSLSIGNVRYVSIMSELSPGHLSAELHFPSPPRLPVGTLEFSELWKDGQVDAAIAIGSWSIDLEGLANAISTPANVLEVTAPAQPNAADEPPPVRSGYQITAVGSNDLLFSRLTVEVVLGAEPDGAPATPIRGLGVTVDVAGERRAVNLVPGDNDSVEATFTLPRPPRAVTVHLQLFDVHVMESVEVWSMIADIPFRLTPRQANFGRNTLIVDATGADYQVVARTSGHVDGQLITVTVSASRTNAGNQSR